MRQCLPRSFCWRWQSRRSLGGGGEKIKRASLCRDSPSFFVTGSYHRLLFAADHRCQRDRGVPVMRAIRTAAILAFVCCVMNSAEAQQADAYKQCREQYQRVRSSRTSASKLVEKRDKPQHFDATGCSGGITKRDAGIRA
jgi:hypothetical protein